MDISLFYNIVGIGSLVLQILSLILIVFLWSKRRIFKSSEKKKILLFILTIITFSIIGSFLYSDYFGIAPCKLCWFQRMFLVPQLILILIALWKNKIERIYYELFIFSFIGFLIAIYQALEQFRVSLIPSATCTLEPNSSCSAIHMLQFGYITFPVASASVFLVILVLSLHLRKRKA